MRVYPSTRAKLAQAVEKLEKKVIVLTVTGWSHTLNVLLVSRDGFSDCSPLLARSAKESGPALRSIVAQTHLSTQSAPAP